jgi:hypothetical protein
VLINPSGDITWHYWKNPDIWPEIFYILQNFLPDDVTHPTINSFSLTKCGSELSIFEPSVTIYANITDNRYVNETTLIVETSDEILYYSLEVSKKNGYFEVDETITLSPLSLYQESQVDYTFEATDMWNLTSEMIIDTLEVIEYEDKINPIIGDIYIEIIELDEGKFTALIYAVIIDDLLVFKAQIQLFDVFGDLILIKNFMPFNATHMKATLANLQYYEDQPHIFTLEITVTDISGKTAEFTMYITDKTTERTDTILSAILFALLLFGCFVLNKKRS